MILTKLQLNESTELEFAIEIFGTPEKTSSVRFVIEGKGYDVSIPCTVDGENVKVVIPKLKGIMESGEYAARLECVIDGKIFTPLNESVEFLPLVEFDVKKTKAAAVKEGVKVAVKSKTPMLSEDLKDKKSSKIEEMLKAVMEEGYDVSRVEDKFIIKSGDAYRGVISQDGTTQISEKKHMTLKALLEDLNATK